MQCARAILSCVACLAVPYFSTLSHKRKDIRKELLNKICVLIFLYNVNVKNSNSKKN
jgi:hypothetical protein